MGHWSWIVLALAALPAAGGFYQAVGGLRDRRRFLRGGRLVRLGDGQQLYMVEMGRGGPSVIFESGIAATSQNWLALQREVSALTHTVSYDRSGLGFSGPCRTERTPTLIVRELREMLLQAGVPPPYVLVGHSFGGLVVRRFAELHPDEVAGVVLLDAMRTDDWPPVNDTSAAVLARGIRLTGIGREVARFGLARIVVTSLLCRTGSISRAVGRAAGNGGMHVLDRITCEVGKMPREVWPIVAAHWSSPGYYRGMAAHLRAVPASVREMHDAGPLAKLPVVLLTAGTAEPLSGHALRRISPHAQQQIAERSGHWVHLDQPELVLHTVRAMLEHARNGAMQAARIHTEESIPMQEA
jgi:pimeloyl-ACP methyl ester carboxylesterase